MRKLIQVYFEHDAENMDIILVSLSPGFIFPDANNVSEHAAVRGLNAVKPFDILPWGHYWVAKFSPAYA
jgi:hypothetical protein